MVCEYFGVCGGCTYLDMPYDEELKNKEAMVRDLLAPFKIRDWEGILPVTPGYGPRSVFDGFDESDPGYAVTYKAGYRNKMEFAFGDLCKNGPLALGIRKRRNFYEVAVPSQCVLIPDDFKVILEYVLRYCRESGETFYHRKRHTGALRHLVLRRGEFTGEVLVNLVTTSQAQLDINALACGMDNLRLNGKAVGLLHTVNDGVADTVKNENVSVISGRDYFFETINGLTFKINAFSFFQTNSAGAESLYGKVREYAGTGRTAYDLYCGTGTVAQVLAEGFEQVIGVELNPEAVQAAGENAKLNHIANCRFIAGDVLKIADELKEAPDCIIADPPRDGLHPKALPKILAMGAERLVYVSCKPSSLARDMAIMTEWGYRIKKAVCIDMFPRTKHVETVCLMSRK
jgi:23S rRNA (uracil-5-)-methyltransferase RumA